MTTQDKFLTMYRDLLRMSEDPTYAWAKDEARLDKFLASVRRTVTTLATTWAWDSPLARQAWTLCGMKGVRYSLSKLRALP